MRHKIAFDERGRRKPLDPDNPSVHYTIRVTKEMNKKLRDIGAKRVREILSSFFSEDIKNL